MDTPHDDQILGPTENAPITNDNQGENTNEIPSVQNDPTESSNTSINTNNVDESKAYHLPSSEEILNKLNQEIQNDFKQLENMADQQTPPTTEPTTPAAEKPKKKKEVETPLIVKKDQTVLILSIVVLLVAAGIFAWQNWKRRKDEENTIDMQQQAQKEYDEYNSYRQ